MSNRSNSGRAGPPGYRPTGPPGHPRHRAPAPRPMNTAQANQVWIGKYVPTPGVDEEKVLKEYNVYAYPEKDPRPHAVFTSAPVSPAEPPHPLKKQGSFSSMRSIKRPLHWLKRSSSSSSSKSLPTSSKPIKAPHIRGDAYLATLASVHGTSSTEMKRAHFEAQKQQRAAPFRRRNRLQEGSPPMDKKELDYLQSYRQDRARARDNNYATFLKGEPEASRKAWNLWIDSVNSFLPHERRELYDRAKAGHESSIAQWKKLRELEDTGSDEIVDLKRFMDTPNRKPSRIAKTLRDGAVNIGTRLHIYGDPDRLAFSDAAPPGTMDRCSVCGREPLGILSRNGKCRSCK